MLFRQTTRLVDHIIAQRYWIPYRDVLFSRLCEAELVLPSGCSSEEKFPPELDFHRFRMGLQICGTDHPLGLSSTKHRDAYLPYASHARSGEQGPIDKYHILWITPSVFVSLACLMLDGWYMYDYLFRISPKDWNQEMWQGSLAHFVPLKVYSLSSFQQHGKPLPPSNQGIDFVSHLFKTLPADYFREIDLEWHRADFPPTLCVAFLSILGSRIAAPRPHHETIRSKTILGFGSWLNDKQREAVLSARHELLSNGNIRVMFKDNSGNADVPKLNTALAQCHTIRHVASSTLRMNKGDIPFSTNSHFESILITLFFESPWLSQFLAGVKQNSGTKHLYIRVVDWSETLTKHIGFLLREVLPGHRSLIDVHVTVFSEGYPSMFWDQLVLLLSELGQEIYSINLRHFSIESSYDSKKALPDKSFQKWWDAKMVPVLILNWYRNEPRQRLQIAQQLGRKRAHNPVTHSVQEPGLALKVLYVNNGHLYCMVTTHVPSSDMTIANASVLFRMGRDYFA
jgi:hypothetical protein